MIRACLLSALVIFAAAPIHSQEGGDKVLLKACPSLSDKLEKWKPIQAEQSEAAAKFKANDKDAVAACNYFESQHRLMLTMRNDVRACLPSLEPVIHEMIGKLDEAVLKVDLMRQHYNQLIGCR